MTFEDRGTVVSVLDNQAEVMGNLLSIIGDGWDPEEVFTVKFKVFEMSQEDLDNVPEFCGW